MEYDPKRIEETVLALLATFSFDGGRSWKGYDFEVMNALHEQGLIDAPPGQKQIGVANRRRPGKKHCHR